MVCWADHRLLRIELYEPSASDGTGFTHGRRGGLCGGGASICIEHQPQSQLLWDHWRWQVEAELVSTIRESLPQLQKVLTDKMKKLAPETLLAGAC
jgi:hypothetical protein